jgi:ketosteroid isomerase-like protein
MKKEDVGSDGHLRNSPQVVMFDTGEMMVKGPTRSAGVHVVLRWDGREVLMAKQEYRVLGDAVVGYGLFSLTTVPSLGPEVKIDGRYTEIIAKRDGKWVYILDHASIPISPNAPAEAHIESIQPGLPPPSE